MSRDVYRHYISFSVCSFPDPMAYRFLPRSLMASSPSSLIALLAACSLGLFYQQCLLVALLPSAVQAYTRPDQLDALLNLKRVASAQSATWSKTLENWVCPTDSVDSDASCDPCSKDWSGNWEFIHCRGSAADYGEGSKGQYDGYVTNVHITDQRFNGPPPREFCQLTHLRELDLDGADFVGPFPEFITGCLPYLQELDLSYNRLTGMLPAELSEKKLLQEFKIEHNLFVGSLPASMGYMPKLRVLRVNNNQFSGKIPQEFKNLAPTLNQLDLSHNNFEGDLSGLSGVQLMLVTLHDNPKLCGMVPAGVRWAKGFNPYGTKLGLPC